MLTNLFKKKYNFISTSRFNEIKLRNYNFLIVLLASIGLLAFFIFYSSAIEKKDIENKKNLKEITKSSEFSKFTNFFTSKIHSPYNEVKYKIKNNDTVEKILKNFNIRNQDIKNISFKIKQKKLSNIYSGRELSLIYKKLEDGSFTVVNLLYPINNTSSIEVRKIQDTFLIKENIIKLYKKEVVVKNDIKNNLYSSAINAKIEPNIIVEFARIFGFEVDFQRDIRKEIGLKSIMKI